MRVGASLTSSHATDDTRRAVQHMIERARVAHEAGLDSLSLGDQHTMPVPYFQNVPMLGRLLAEWTSGRPVGCLFLLPLWHPVIVAEQVGTLASMTDGPFVVQTGIGRGAERFAAMGADMRTRGATTDEAIRVIKGLLAGETVTSERFGITDAAINPIPHQAVEWWIGVGSAGPLQRAGREGAWYAGTGASVEQIAAMGSTYREACVDHGNDAPQVIMRTDVIVLDDDAAATARADALVASGYRGMSRDQVIAGGVERVTEAFARYAEVGVDEVVVRCMSVPQAEALETLTLCGEVRRQLA